MLKRFLLYSMTYFLLVTCNTEQKTKCYFENIKFIPDTLRIEHSKNNDIRLSQIASIFNLDNIDSGYNSRQIRIWLGHSLAIKHRIVIIKFKDSKWTGEVLTYTRQDLSRKISSLKILDYKKVAPNSGWDKFIKTINDKEILTEEFWKSPYCCGEGGGDGISYDFEIASSSTYAEHSFSNPSNQSQIGRKIMDFASFLETELCFKYTKD